ncbi:helix-turn-helix domain-containing protein [Streptomyces sp. NRRL B-1347]|uniref:helix-turn-helix domain-containing protein n=1 Tax=Streptomyces sp. NRRL B-1347 TaxID=1476877 RepID=UPI0004CA12DE|nr:helix-turn-helix transcriptional regulator [Streptomyces sp. NRRL B-1347]
MLHLDTDVLKAKAKEAGHLTHEQIAAHAGIDRSAVSRFFAGRSTPSLPTVVSLARAYGLMLDDLVPAPAADEVPA